MKTREQKLAQKRARYWANPGVIRERNKAEYRRNLNARLAKAAIYREQNRELLRVKALDRYHDGPGKRQARERLLSKYGLTLATYDDLLNGQGGRCAICGRLPNGKPLVIDHDHETGVVRGLLCDACNQALGLLSDDQSVVARALGYLEAHD